MRNSVVSGSIQILPSDTGIFSQACGIWTLPKATSYNPDRATAKTGFLHESPPTFYPAPTPHPAGPSAPGHGCHRSKVTERPSLPRASRRISMRLITA